MHVPSYSPMIWGNFRLTWGERTAIMGIVNVTPDSFSGDGLAQGEDAEVWAARAVTLGMQQVAEGADIIDVGGASSRPKSRPVSPAIEIARVVPAIRALRAALPLHIPISVDTTSVAVAQAALAVGANMINDISGLHMEPELAHVAKEAGVPIVLMANMRGIAKHDVVQEVSRYLGRSLELARTAGMHWDSIILDPGFGFGNTPAENMALVRRLEELLVLGRPLLLGVSRKSTLGHLLGDAPVEKRLEASLAAAVAGVLHGAAMVRVHDVRTTWHALRVADALRYDMHDSGDA
jgi:dihydropteroate synthase